jgi:hypothetical protein
MYKEHESAQFHRDIEGIEVIWYRECKIEHTRSSYLEMKKIFYCTNLMKLSHLEHLFCFMHTAGHRHFTNGITSRFRRVLMMVYNTRDYWFYGRCP